LQETLDFKRDSLSAVGVSAAVIMPGMGTWLGASGISDSSNDIRTGMLFSIASVTKTYIAALVLLLAEEETLTLDDSLHQWLPTYPHIDSTITVHQLLNHTSGIYSFHENPAFWDSMFTDNERLWTPEEMVTTFIEEPYFPPGEGWHYSNTNYLLLGMIIREATDSDVSTELRRRILNPLHIRNTFLDIEEEIPDNLAHGWHDLNEDGEPEDIFHLSRTAWYSAIWTGGAMVATAEDVAVWAGGLFDDDLLDEASLDEMLDFVEIPFGWFPFTGYGLGMGRIELFDMELWGHSGDIPGYNSIVMYSVDDNVSISVLVNCNAVFAANTIGYGLYEVIRRYLGISPTPPSTTPHADEFTLQQNYPNPFNSITTLTYSLPVGSRVSLGILDISGRVVLKLVDGYQKSGAYNVDLEAGTIPCGMYMIRLEASGGQQWRKALLVK